MTFCITDHAVRDANCLAVLSVLPVCQTQGSPNASYEAGRILEEPFELRHIYSLLADIASRAADMLYSLLSWLTQWTQPWCSSKMPPLSRWSSHMHTAHNLWPSEYLVTCMHSGYKWSQLLQNNYLQNVGKEWEAMEWESLTTPTRLICSLPTPSFMNKCPKVFFWINLLKMIRLPI